MECDQRGTNVCIIEGYKPDDKISMDLYAAKLRGALHSAERGFHVCVTQPDGSFPSIQDEALRKFIGIWDRFLRFPWKLLQMKRGLRSSVFHITDHTNSYLTSCLPHAHTVVTCHDLIPLLAGDGRFEGVSARAAGDVRYFRYCISGLKKARYVIADSECTKRHLIEYNLCSPSALRVIYPGLNFAYHPMPFEERMEARTKYGLEDKYVMLHVGSSVFYKNIETIIKSLNILCKKKHNKDFIFVKAGKPFTKSQYRLVQAYGLEDSTRYIGAPHGFSEMQEVYNLADVFVFPSLYEGFGWPPLEAMACGIPVVCSDRGSLGEVVQSAAVICDPDDPESLAESVMLLRDNEPIRRGFIRKGIENSNRFKWSVTSRKVAELYWDVLHHA